MSREAGLKAARAKKAPFVVEQEDIDDLKAGAPKFTIPNIGDHRPKSWELLEILFVDASGCGDPGEPALTQKQFAERMKPGFGYAVIEVGQFQVYVGKFQKIKKAKAGAA
jgi:hypothetical protein